MILCDCSLLLTLQTLDYVAIDINVGGAEQEPQSAS